MRRVMLALVIGLLACQRDSASTSPDDAAGSSDSGAPPPSTPEDKAVIEEPDQALLTIEGGLTEAQVQKVVDDHFTDIKTCFDLALAHPDGVHLLEPIVVQVQVDGTGKVAESKLERSKFGDQPTEACIVERAEGWSFPAPKGKKPATLHIPFLLRSY